MPRRPRPNRLNHDEPQPDRVPLDRSQTDAPQSRPSRPDALPSDPSRSDAPPPGHRLGSFRFAKTLEFVVIGDDTAEPKTVRVMLDDGFQEPYRILTIEGLDRFRPPPESDWLEGWITKGDPWASIIYGSTIGVVRQARSDAARRGRQPDR